MKVRWLAKASVTGFALLALLTVGFITPNTASANPDYNDYIITGLPPYLTAPATFTVTVDGPDAICSMEYQGVSYTTPPWTFTIDPQSTSDYSSTTVKPYYCNTEYGHDYISLETIIPFEFQTKVLVVTKGKNLTTAGYVLRNDTDQPATLTIKNPEGETVASASVPAETRTSGDPLLRVPTKGITKTQRYTATATLPDGTSMTAPLWMAVGWGILLDDRPATWEPCATITWSYNTKGQPKKANTFKKDIKLSLARLAKITGITFVEVPFGYHEADTGMPARLQYDWTDMGKNGPSGIGGTDGGVTFNNKDYWPLNVNAGFGYLHNYLPGRGWLVIHETMHVMGYDHVNDRTQVMNPIGHASKFGTGDLAGLHAMYPKNCQA